MLNIAISVTFKLIILIMLLYILAYIVDIIYFEVYLYPKLLEEELKKEDENVEIIEITDDDDLDKVVDDIKKKIKELKDNEWICLNWKHWNRCRDLYRN